MKTTKTSAAPLPARMTPAEAIATLRDAASLPGPSAKGRELDLWNRVVKETARVAAELNPALTVTLHIPRWCVKQWEKEAASAGLTVGQLMTFLATGDWRLNHVLAEGVGMLCEDMLEDLDKKPTRPGAEVKTKIAVELSPATLKHALARAAVHAKQAAAA